jgi:hypothetical protein
MQSESDSDAGHRRQMDHQQIHYRLALWRRSTKIYTGGYALDRISVLAVLSPPVGVIACTTL